MFAQFLDIVFKSLKLDKTLYRTPRYYGEAGIYFAILIMILDGVAGAIAANTIVKNVCWYIWFNSIINLAGVGNFYICNWS